MQTISIQAFRIDELEGKARAKAFDFMHELETSEAWTPWFADLLTEWKEKLEDAGYKNPDIQFSGFYNQGDGASFTCDVIDLTNWMKAKHFKPLARLVSTGELTGKVYRTDYHYSHEKSVSVALTSFASLSGCDEDSLAELEKAITIDVENLSKSVFRALRNEYEARTAENVLIEIANENSFLFDKYGERINYLTI